MLNIYVFGLDTLTIFFFIIDKTLIFYDLLKLEMEYLQSNIKFAYTDVVALTEQRINFLDVCIPSGNQI